MLRSNTAYVARAVISLAQDQILDQTFTCSVTLGILANLFVSYFHIWKTGIVKVNDIIITKAEFDKAIDKELNNSMFVPCFWTTSQP